MANPEHVATLRKGVAVWNAWRKREPESRPDLAGADLSYLELAGVDFRDAVLQGASLAFSGLGHRRYRIETPGRISVGTEPANLSGANLCECVLVQAVLVDTFVSGTDFSHAHFGQTRLVDIDLSTTILKGCRHLVPSSISIGTIRVCAHFLARKPENREAVEEFFGQCGVQEPLLAYFRSLLDATDQQQEHGANALVRVGGGHERDLRIVAQAVYEQMQGRLKQAFVEGQRHGEAAFAEERRALIQALANLAQTNQAVQHMDGSLSELRGMVEAKERWREKSGVREMEEDRANVHLRQKDQKLLRTLDQKLMRGVVKETTKRLTGKVGDAVEDVISDVLSDDED